MNNTIFLDFTSAVIRENVFGYGNSQKIVLTVEFILEVSLFFEMFLTQQKVEKTFQLVSAQVCFEKRKEIFTP